MKSLHRFVATVPAVHHAKESRSAIMSGRRSWLFMALLVFLWIATIGTWIALFRGHSHMLASSAINVHQRSIDSQPETFKSTSDLGVRMIRPVYSIIPKTADGRVNVTVVLTVWLKRVGARGGPFDMPHQTQDAIRLMVWADDPGDIHRRQWGHLKLPAEHKDWVPQLLLETAEPGPVLRVEYEPRPEQSLRVADHVIRPYSFRVDLPDGAGDCFKLLEASYPKHKEPVCLASAKLDDTCDWLAPPDRYNASHPALYTTIGAVRSTASPRDWKSYNRRVAVQVWNYVTYQVAIGASGLLLYADELQRQYLAADPNTAELMRRGHLRLIEWDMPERGHDDDGRGRPLGYNYDQALFASHVNLGLSSCGANLWVIVTDIDEYIYIPKPGRRWPEPLLACMHTAGANVTLHSLPRFEVMTSRRHPEQERHQWFTPGNLSGPAPDPTSAASDPSELLKVLHPLELYDRVYSQPLSRMHGKAVILPAARAVMFFVHEAVPLIGRSQLVDETCMALLHVVNFHGNRRLPPNDTVLRPFQHWVFAAPGTVNESMASVGTPMA